MTATDCMFGKVKMHCLKNEHEVLTDSGWKYFQDIDITKDKLYTMEFQQGTHDKSMKFKTTYKYAIDRHYCPNKEQELYHIKNDYIDIIITSEHRLPVKHFVYTTNYAINKYDICTIDEIYSILKQEYIPFVNENNISLFMNNQTLIDVKLCDITKLPNQVETTFCFTMPDETFYVRRNGKEYWTGNSC